MGVLEPLCSTGCFSRDPGLSSIDLVTRGMRQLRGTSFEVIFYSGWFDAAVEIARTIAATGAPTPVLHAEKSIENLLCQVGTPMDAVARCLDVDPRAGITLDTAFLAMHDQLEAAIIDDRVWTISGVNHVHLKDYADPGLGWGKAGYLHPDEGSLDLSGFIKGLRTRGYGGAVTLEAHPVGEDNSPDIARIESSLDWIRRSLAEPPLSEP